MALHGSSYDFDLSEPGKPQGRNGASADLILLLVLGLVLAVIFVPSLRERAVKALTLGTQQKIKDNVLVWANKDAGYYYCSGDRFYGHAPGSFMKQGDALTLGYQPNLGKYCDGEQPSDTTEVKKIKRNARLPATDPRSSGSNRVTSLPAPRR